MTIRTKTIEYCCPLDTSSVATAVSRALAQIAALSIPETTSRTFRSVTLELFLTESGTVAATSRAGNGAYSMTWFDNTVDVFTEARESGTLVARSDTGKAS